MIKQVYNILLKNIQLRQKQKEIFDKVQVGDMLWCKMPLSKLQLSKIERNHRIRPYLVVKKEQDFLWCYQSSSKNREEINNYEKYGVNSGKYKNKKTSWIDLKNIKKIKIRNIQLEFITLNQIEIKKIEKRICIGQNRGNTKLIRFNEPIYIEEGDVVVKNEKSYYIYTEDNVNIYGFRIQKKLRKKQRMKNIKINGKTYYTNFKELITIRRNENAKVINMAYKEEMLLILDQKKSLKANTYNKIEENIRRDKSRFAIGSVFQHGNSKVMYLYSIGNKYYGVDLLWYSIKPRVFEIRNIQKRKLIETKNLEEMNKILEVLIERNGQDSRLETVYQYVRNLLFSSVV